MIMRKDRQEAMRRIEEGLSHCPNNAYLWQALGDAARKGGDTAAARAHFTQALKFDAQHVPTFHTWARMEARQGNLANAMKLLDRGLAIAPDNTRLIMTAAIVQEGLGLHEHAAQLLDDALRDLVHRTTGEENPQLLYSRALLHYKYHNVTEARVLLSRAVRQKPKYVRSWLLRQCGAASLR